MSEYYKDAHRYDDIMHLPHHQSRERRHMSLHDRAAQFAPFAALTGYGDAIEETARLTVEKVSLTETELAKINEVLIYIAEHLSEKLTVSITYFKADLLKSGGAYLTDIGTVEKINLAGQCVIMDSGIKIAMEDIAELKINE